LCYKYIQLIIIIIIFIFFIDGVIENKALVEIKCPYAAKNTSNIKEAIDNKQVSGNLLINDDMMHIKI